VPGGPCLIDSGRGQFETALINMAVNARDAMGGEGRLTIAVRACGRNSRPRAISEAPRLLRRGFNRGYRQAAFRRITSDASLSRSSPPRKSDKAPVSALAGVRFTKTIRGEVTVDTLPGKGKHLHAVFAAGRSAMNGAAGGAGGSSVVDGHGISVLVVEDNIEVGKFATDALAGTRFTPPRWSATPPHALEELGERRRPFRRGVFRRRDAGMTGIDSRRKSAAAALIVPWC